MTPKPNEIIDSRQNYVIVITIKQEQKKINIQIHSKTCKNESERAGFCFEPCKPWLQTLSVFRRISKYSQIFSHIFFSRIVWDWICACGFFLLFLFFHLIIEPPQTINIHGIRKIHHLALTNTRPRHSHDMSIQNYCNTGHFSVSMVYFDRNTSIHSSSHYFSIFEMISFFVFLKQPSSDLKWHQIKKKHTTFVTCVL